tara:strand:+ start:552 stop:827 length:276 start_codon:yes stop_codon:yes gene_type:complete
MKSFIVFIIFGVIFYFAYLAFTDNPVGENDTFRERIVVEAELSEQEQAYIPKGGDDAIKELKEDIASFNQKARIQIDIWRNDINAFIESKF